MELSEIFVREARHMANLRFTKGRCPKRNFAAAYDREAWSPLGSGHFGEAWRHVDYPGLVLKLSGPAGFGVGSIDSPYGDAPLWEDAWQKYAEMCSNVRGPHLPRIQHFERKTALFAWAIMPEYYRLSYAEQPDTCRIRDMLLGLDRITEEYFWLIPIKKMARGHRIDLHDGNIMKDAASGEFIITDPFSS